VDFLHSTNWVVSQARLPNYMYYSGMDFTYKLDRKTVMVGARSILAISTSPIFAGASSSTGATTGSTAPVVAEGSGLPSSVDVGTTSSAVGAGLRLLSVAPPTVSSCLLPPDPRGRTMESHAIQLSPRNTSRQELNYSLEELTSWEVVVFTFSFLVTHFRATLCGLLGGAGRLASRLVAGSSIRGILGSSGRLNLDRN
jgi:hypothetical protein